MKEIDNGYNITIEVGKREENILNQKADSKVQLYDLSALVQRFLSGSSETMGTCEDKFRIMSAPSWIELQPNSTTSQPLSGPHPYQTRLLRTPFNKHCFENFGWLLYSVAGCSRSEETFPGRQRRRRVFPVGNSIPTRTSRRVRPSKMNRRASIPDQIKGFVGYF
jgi:hypothetical protein